MQTWAGTTIPHVLEYRAHADAHTPLLVLLGSEPEPATRTFSYAEFGRLVAHCARRLDEVVDEPGRRVAILADNSLDLVAWLCAAWTLGLVPVPVAPDQTSRECRVILSDCRPSAVVCLAARAPAVHAAIDGLEVGPVVVSDLLPEAAALLSGPDPELPSRRALPTGADDALILYTSGSTGQPKGVVLSVSACLSAGATTADALRLRPDDRLHCILPLYHANALFFLLFPALVTGATLVLDRFSVRDFLPTVVRQQVTVANLTAGAVRLLLRQPPNPWDRRHRLRVAMFGLPLRREEIEAFEERFGVPLSMHWGLTETCAIATRTPLHFRGRKGWQSLGMVLPGWEIDLVAHEDATDDLEGVGELVVRGPSVMSRYHDDEDATREAFTDDGWLRTGDLGSIDEDGYVYFRGRRKEIYKVKGKSVSGEEVQGVLASVAGVGEAVIVALPDPVLEERLVGVVVPQPGVVVDTAELTRVCELQLSAYKRPTRVHVLEDVPRTAVGKVDKRALTSLVAGLDGETAG
jgi:acyl-CoA synthetase (AMP-forming)/AMP-acid ligase II